MAKRPQRRRKSADPLADALVRTGAFRYKNSSTPRRASSLSPTTSSARPAAKSDRRTSTTSSARPTANPRRTTSSARPAANPRRVTSSARPATKPVRQSSSRASSSRPAQRRDVIAPPTPRATALNSSARPRAQRAPTPGTRRCAPGYGWSAIQKRCVRA